MLIDWGWKVGKLALLFLSFLDMGQDLSGMSFQGGKRASGMMFLGFDKEVLVSDHLGKEEFWFL
jgi:hypothetical protein